MNHLLAKIKGRGENIFKVISDDTFFDLPENIDNAISYDSNYKLEDDEWFCVAEFSTKEYCIDFLNREFISADYNQIGVADYSKIKYLIANQDNLCYFQKISPSSLIEKKYLSLLQEPEFIDGRRIIIIHESPDAIYNRYNDALYFKRLSSLTSIFKGIDELHREATQPEVEEFLESDFISLSGDYCADSVKTTNRKRIAMARETLQRYTPAEKTNIYTYIREYCPALAFNENDENFSISDEEDLKQLLYGIEQRFYTTRVGNERRLANSIMTL